MDAPHDIGTTPLHLGLGATARPLEGFSWDPSYLASYEERTAADGDEGRLVTLHRMEETWDVWEAHPAGEEVVLCLEGRLRLWQERGGEEVATEVGPGQYLVNPLGCSTRPTCWSRGAACSSRPAGGRRTGLADPLG